MADLKMKGNDSEQTMNDVGGLGQVGLGQPYRRDLGVGAAAQKRRRVSSLGRGRCR
jgi:hypothetical protein